MNDEQF
jgi:hypothetical protein